MFSALLKPFLRSAPAPAAVPAGSRVYAIGDIHGRADLLETLHAAILADADGAPGAVRRVAVYIGDYVDRGLHAREVIDLLLDAPLPGFESVHLKGNHEDMMLRFLADAAAGPPWFANGGEATLLSYGVGGPPPRDAAMLEDVRLRLVAALPPRHLAFLEGLALSHREGGYLFVHAGLRPGVPATDQRDEDLMWIRDDFLESTADHGVIVVHGHSIAYEPERHANRIGIDTGAFTTGRLTSLVLDGESQRFMST